MNGVVLIDKPAGRTSHDVVGLIRKIAGVKKVGHAGTLDPLATGVLAVCINEGTKLVQFLIQDHKEYRATLLLGTETDTLDVEGAVTVQSDVDVVVEASQVEAALASFLGTSEQKTPRYSALKYKGKPRYKWARAGIHLEPPSRTVEIHAIRMVSMDLPYVTFDVSCSKGTYIRSLCRDIGGKLGFPACLAKLRRTRSGHFFEAQAVAIEGLEFRQITELLERSLISLNDALPDVKAIAVPVELAERIQRGYQPGYDEVRDGMQSVCSSGEIVKLTTEDNRLLAVGRIPEEAGCDSEENGDPPSGIKILRVFNN